MEEEKIDNEQKDLKKRIINIYIDGGCSHNGKENSIGKFGYVSIENDKILHSELKAERKTTNNRMEMKAMILALRYLKTIEYESCDIFTDSSLVKRGITEWYPNWEKKNFKNIKNVELWKELYSLYKETNNIKIKWVKGHNNNKWNEYIDLQLKKLNIEKSII